MGLRDDKVPVRQRLQRVLDANRVARVHERLRGRGREPAAEHGESQEQLLLPAGEELVAPGDRRAQRPLTIRYITRESNDVQAPAEPFEQRLG